MQEDAEFLGGGEGIISLPLPHGEPKQETVEELLLFGHRKMNKHTKNKDKYD